MRPFVPDGRWEARWRVVSTRARMLNRHLTARGREGLRAAVAKQCQDAFAGEVRLTAPDGRIVWTDLVEIAGWRDGAAPRERRDGLWQAEAEFEKAAGATLAAIDDAVALGRRTGVLRPHDGFSLIDFAERLVARSRVLPGVRPRS